jgi:probable phosphoglycerate mutase
VPDASAGERAEVVLVRHAETEWSRDGRHTGLTDLPLTERGRARARALADTLGADAGTFGLVLVSPSVRARETAELSGLGGPVQVREDLHEWDYGDYEGRTTADIREQRPAWDLWRDGCPGGEDANAVGARADRVIAELRSLDGRAAVFSHGHFLRVLGARWIGLPADAGAHLGLGTAALCVLGYERSYAILAHWNETPANAR